MKYYKHIDGLRALAVLSVIFVHLDFTPFSGGYVGVDVFFVISGFLITNIIVKELNQTNTFCFINFYTRRVRRILPALVFVLIVSLILSILLLNLAKFKVFGGSLATAVISFSNVFFYKQAGYFDIFSQSSPLLHTWSLGVEEQFYIFWPIALLVVFKFCKKSLMPFVISVFVVSILISLYKQNTDLSILYYYAPFRAFEFCIGATLVWLMRYKTTKNSINETVCLVGLVFILYSIFKYDSNTLFPSYNALLPCIGAGLIIYSGTAKITGYLFRNKFVSFIGLISYSLYLIHWPLIVFAKTLHEDIGRNFGINTITKLIVLTISIIVAILMYYFIEQPFRENIPKDKPSQQKLLFRWFFVMVIFVALGGSIFYSKGWLWRAKPLNAVVKVDDISKYHEENWGGAGFSHQGLKYGTLPAKIILMGDSHSGMLEYGIVNVIAKPLGLSVYGISGGHGTLNAKGQVDPVNKYSSSLMLPGISKTGSAIFSEKWNDQSSVEANKDLIKSIKQDKKSILIYSASYAAQINTSLYLKNHRALGVNTATMSKYYQYKPFVDSLEKLKQEIGSHKLVLIGDVPQSIKYNVQNCMGGLRWFNLGNCKSEQQESLNIGAIHVNKILQEFAEKHRNVYFINPYNVFCKDGYCKNLSNNGTPFYSDGSHLSRTGSVYFIKGVKSQIIDIITSR